MLGQGSEHRKVLRWSAAWFATYLAVSVLLTWPLAAQLATNLPRTSYPCTFDLLHIGWALAHQSDTLVHSPTSYAQAGIYHPEPNALFYGQTGIGALPVFAPIYLATGNPTLTLNVVFLLGLTLTALSFHLTVFAVTGSQAAGLISGWTFLMSRWVLYTFVPSVPNYSLLFLFPVILLIVSRPSADARSVRWLVPLLVLQCLPDVAYLAASLLAPLVVVAALRLAGPRTRSSGWYLATALLLVCLALLPLYWAYFEVSRANPYLETQTRWLAGQPRTTFPGGFRAPPYPTATPEYLLPWILTGLALAIQRRKEGSPLAWAMWKTSLVFVVVGATLSLTPRIDWYGTTVALPHDWIGRWFPVYERLRVPARLGISALVGVSVLAGMATAEIVHKITKMAGGRRQSLIGAALAVVVASVWGLETIPSVDWPLGAYPLQSPPSPDSSLVRALRRGSGPIVEIPLRLDDPEGEARAMYRSIFHGRPLVNGYHGYWPSNHPRRARTANQLPDARALIELVDETGIENVVVHPALLRRHERERWRQAASDEIPGLRYEESGRGTSGEWILYRVSRRGMVKVGGTAQTHRLGVAPDGAAEPVSRPIQLIGSCPRWALGGHEPALCSTVSNRRFEAPAPHVFSTATTSQRAASSCSAAM